MLEGRADGAMLEGVFETGLDGFVVISTDGVLDGKYVGADDVGSLTGTTVGSFVVIGL